VSIVVVYLLMEWTMDIDIGKNSFHVVGLDERGAGEF
jgi:hypothetical protein